MLWKDTTSVHWTRQASHWLLSYTIQQVQVPHGLSSVSEHYNHRMKVAFTELSGSLRLMNDIVWRPCYPCFAILCRQEHCPQYREVQILSHSSHFAGFQFSVDGYQVDQSLPEAISKYVSPTNHTDLWYLVGLFNQFSTSTSEVATFLAPLGSLLSTKISYYVQVLMMKHSWMWKVPYYATSVVFLWNVTKPAHLSAASKQRLGFILQENFWAMDTDSGRISVLIRYRDILS